jgi:hypothetical protein
MLPKSVVACLAVTAFATNALTPTGASAFGGRGGAGIPMQGTYRWPPGAFGTDGGTPGPTCGYVWVNPYRHKPGNGRWAYRCH